MDEQDDPIAKAAERVVGLRLQYERARDVLRKLEWSDRCNAAEYPTCPICHKAKPDPSGVTRIQSLGHDVTCALKAVLNEQ